MKAKKRDLECTIFYQTDGTYALYFERRSGCVAAFVYDNIDNLLTDLSSYLSRDSFGHIKNFIRRDFQLMKIFNIPNAIEDFKVNGILIAFNNEDNFTVYTSEIPDNDWLAWSKYLLNKRSVEIPIINF